MQKDGLSKFDMLATLTALTARSLALNYQLHLRSWPQTLILTGGGAANATLLKAIRAAIEPVAPDTQLRTSDALGWPLQSIEPAAFALLAYLRVHSRPGNLPQTTGASRAVRLGQISEP
jgi:anhydro-N-acetylmuramic acid kinase